MTWGFPNIFLKMLRIWEIIRTFAAQIDVKMKELYYKVAEHVFVLKTGEHDSLLGELRQYENHGDRFLIESSISYQKPVPVIAHNTYNLSIQ